MQKINLAFVKIEGRGGGSRDSQQICRWSQECWRDKTGDLKAQQEGGELSFKTFAKF